MERKIGEIFEHNGEWYQCVNGFECTKCDLHQNKRCTARYNDIGSCSKNSRKDNTPVIFKKLEKVGEPYVADSKCCQQYQCYTTPLHNRDIIYTFSDNRVVLEIKNKEDMKEKNNGNTPLNVLTDKYVNGDICYDDFEKEVKALYSCKEEIKPTLKEFDLEAAKKGKPVYTRDGRKARIICFDRVDAKPILALIASTDGKGEDLFDYFVSGKRIANALESDLDLMMLPEKRSGWVNIVKEALSDDRVVLGRIFDRYEDAFMSGEANERYIATVKIEWTE